MGTRTCIKCFVSYAHVDRRTVVNFMQRLTVQLAPSRRYDYQVWWDTRIDTGQQWRDEIRRQLVACDVGLLLVSPGFLTSEYIAQHELPYFLGTSAKPALPIMLETIDWQRHDVKGLEHYQFFALDHTRAFADCTTPRLRGRFIARLFAQIEQHADRLCLQE